MRHPRSINHSLSDRLLSRLSSRLGANLRPSLLSGLCILALLPGLAPKALASDTICSRLFSTTANSALDLSALNEPSREYVRRLAYLVRERHLFEAEVFTKILNSKEPLNPFEGRSANVHLLPHLTAFRDLFEEHRQDFEWEKIRAAIQTLAQQSEQDSKRSETAAEETKKVLLPVLVRTFPFYVQETVRTHEGQMLAVQYASPDPKKTFSVSAYDLSTGDLVSKTTYDGSGEPRPLLTQAIGDTAMATVQGGDSQRLITFDLKAGRVLSDPVTSSKPTGNIILSELNGQAQIVVVEEGKALFIDPVSGQHSAEMPFYWTALSRVNVMGTVGNDVYFSREHGESGLIDPSGNAPLQRSEKFKALTAFRFQETTFGFGFEFKDYDPSATQYVLKAFDFATGRELRPVTIPIAKGTTPRFIDQFEDNGTVYGLFATTYDLYVIDMVNGQIITKANEVVSDIAAADWRALSPRQSLFKYKGKTYLAVLLRSKAPNPPSQVIIVDAKTLVPVSAPISFQKNVAGLRVIQGKNEDDVYAVVNMAEATSNLISLISNLPRGQQ